MSKQCDGAHRVFVAETFLVERTATVGAIAICTTCGESKLVSYKVSVDPFGAGIQISQRQNSNKTNTKETQ